MFKKKERKKVFAPLKNHRPAVPTSMKSGRWGKCIIYPGSDKFKWWLWVWGRRADLSLQLTEEVIVLLGTAPCNNPGKIHLWVNKDLVIAWTGLPEAKRMLVCYQGFNCWFISSVFNPSQPTFIGFHHGHIYQAISIMIKSLQMRFKM